MDGFVHAFRFFQHFSCVFEFALFWRLLYTYVLCCFKYLINLYRFKRWGWMILKYRMNFTIERRSYLRGALEQCSFF